MIIYSSDEIGKSYSSSDTSTKTIANLNASSSAISDYSKIGNGYAKIEFVSAS